MRERTFMEHTDQTEKWEQLLQLTLQHFFFF